MKKVGSVCVFVTALLCLPGHSVHTAPPQTVNIVGTVVDAHSNPAEGVAISIQDSAGKLIAQVRTNERGEYSLECLHQGQYNLTLHSLPTSLQGQTVVAFLGPKGLIVNWRAATAAPAIAVAMRGGGGCGSAASVVARGVTKLGTVGIVGAGGGMATANGAFNASSTSRPISPSR